MKQGSIKESAAEKQKRLQAALRANLKRRKVATSPSKAESTREQTS
jgi:hypothetical protein